MVKYLSHFRSVIWRKFIIIYWWTCIYILSTRDHAISYCSRVVKSLLRWFLFAQLFKSAQRPVKHDQRLEVCWSINLQKMLWQSVGFKRICEFTVRISCSNELQCRKNVNKQASLKQNLKTTKETENFSFFVLFFNLTWCWQNVEPSFEDAGNYLRKH